MQHDETRGRIRARVFAPDFGIAEDPATGSASMTLCAALGRPVAIDQGPGCHIEARWYRGIYKDKLPEGAKTKEKTQISAL